VQITFDPTDLAWTIVFAFGCIVVFLGWMAFKRPEVKKTRFSLRDILIFTTLAAVALGVAVSVLRSP
jgi:hypothetical protein